MVLAASVIGVIVAAPPPAASAQVPAPVQLPVQLPAQAPVPAELAGATALRPATPCRLFDSRQTPDAGRLDADTWRVAVAGRCNTAPGARAAAINLTVTDVSAAGFVTVWPSGMPRPEVSNLNFETGHTIANSAVVQLSPDGAIDVHNSGRAQVVIDVTAVFVDAPGAVAAGRYVPVEPRRLVETRTSGQRGVHELRIPLPPEVPADAAAIAVTVTAVDAVGYGYLTAYPSGVARPDTSVVNTDENNRTRANLGIVAVSGDGFMVFRSMETDVLVDIWGWFTGPSATAATDGLFIPQAPERVWDSRHSHDPVHPGGTVEHRLAPSPASAVVANVTAVDLTAGGYLSVYAAGTPQPDVSSLNYRWRHPVAALTMSRISDRGVALYSFAGAHLVVDVAGWFTGRPVAAVTGPLPNTFPPGDTHVAFISDSAFAAIRWSGQLGLLQGAVFDSRLESCRRLIGASCRGREGYAPRTVVAELATMVPGANRTLVMATGYDDWSASFPDGVEAVLATARARGFERVVWVTYRENVSYTAPRGASNRATYVANNAHLRAVAASGRHPELVLADWHAYTNGHPAWFAADGVHFTSEGARQAAMYVSRKLAFLERRPCPSGIGGLAAPGGWCADPDLVGPS